MITICCSQKTAYARRNGRFVIHATLLGTLYITSVWAIEKRKQTFYHWSKTAFFLRLSFGRENKYSLKNPDSEFKTGETIWWICYWIWNKISRCILMHTAGIQIKLQLLNWFWHRSVSCMAHLMQNSKLFFSGLSQCGEILLKLCILIFK